MWSAVERNREKKNAPLRELKTGLELEWEETARPRCARVLYRERWGSAVVWYVCDTAGAHCGRGVLVTRVRECEMLRQEIMCLIWFLDPKNIIYAFLLPPLGPRFASSPDLPSRKLQSSVICGPPPRLGRPDTG